MIICPHCNQEFEPKKLKCTRCGHEWYPKVPDKLPEVCPKCKSPYWSRERTRKMKSIRKEGVGQEKTGDNHLAMEEERCGTLKTAKGVDCE